MKIQSKITSFLLVIILAFLLFAFYQFYAQNKSFSVLLQDTKKQQVALFDQLMEVENKNIEVFVRDYTFWDEMVKFISTKDKNFAKENIDTGAETFNADMVQVYDLNYSLVYQVGDIKVDFPEEVFKDLYKNRFTHFFLSNSEGVMEIRGATVHPTDDSDRKTLPKGYFFAGKILDGEYLGALSDINRSAVSIVPSGENTTRFDSINPSRGYISFVRSLVGFNGIPVSFLHVEKEFVGISQFYNSLSKQLWTFVIFLSLLLILVYIFLVLFVARPLRILSRGIRSQDTKPIEGMKEEKSEFGDLAALVLRFSEKIDIAKTEFVSLVSHQLRTPLTIVGWYLERLGKIVKGENSNPKSVEYLNGIAVAKDRMVNLVNATVEISRIESGNLHLELSPVNLEHIVEEVAKELAPTIETKKLDLEKKYDGDLPFPVLDERLVFIIIENILSNAVKYTDPGGHIIVKVSKEEDKIVIIISDTGIGISAEERKKIFEKLFRAQNAREKDPEGSGLGLYIAKALAEAQSGTIELSSVEGKGTTFTVKLPLSISKNS